MRRRAFTKLLGGAIAAWPMAARAQQAAMPVIGLLGVGFEGPFAQGLELIRQGLRSTGFIEGQNVEIEYAAANGQPERLPDLAAQLVRRRVALIITIGASTPAQVAKAATSTIPIIFAMGADPVDLGLVRSLNRPEANVTGASFTLRELAPKRLGLLCELVPQAKVIAHLDNSRLSLPSESTTKALLEAARAIDRDIVALDATTDEEIDAAFWAMRQRHVQGLIISSDAFLNANRGRLIKLAAQHALPTVYAFNDAAAEGGLINYSAITTDVIRQAGVYVGRILKGAKPADLPVVQSTKFELIINHQTARTLGITVPPTLLALADAVIE